MQSGGPPADPEAPSRIWWLPATFSSLRHYNYRLFFFGQLISLTGTMMQGAAIGWLVYQLTNSKELLGTISALRALPILLFSIFGGVIADRYPKRRTLVFTQVASMALAFVLATLLFLNIIVVWQIVVIGILSGFVLAVDIPTRQSFVVEMVGVGDMNNAIALNSSMFNAANIIGPAVGGLTMARMGMGWCFLLNGLSFIAVIAGLLMMRITPQIKPRSSQSALRQAVEGFSLVMHRPSVRGLLMFVAVMGVFGGSYGVLMPVFAKDILHADEKGYGLLLAASAVGAFPGALIVASLAQIRHRSRLIIIGVMLFSATLFFFASATTFLLAAVCLVGVGAGWIFMMSTANTLLQNSVPHEARGRVMGVWALTFVGATPIGSYQIGLMADRFGAPRAVQFGAVICAVAGLFAMYAVMKRRRLSVASNGAEPPPASPS